jgi:hypothetical protein
VAYVKRTGFVRETATVTNVNSRSGSYYNALDLGQTYVMPFEHSASGDGEYSFYLKNTSATKTMVVTLVDVFGDNVARCKLWFVTGTAANGAAVTPRNTNDSSANAAAATGLHDGGGTTISGLTVSGVHIYDARFGADNGHVMDLEGKVRLGQNDAIALEMDTGTATPLIHGQVSFYFE